MTTRKPKSEYLTDLVGVRFPKAERQALDVEAKAKGLETTAYIRMLIKTHPERKRKGG
ncbi:MAG: hypothetical protein V1809_10475 [Planctomycetota bacterium]